MYKLSFVLLGLFMLCSCAEGGLSPLREHLAYFGYTLFETPRDFNGPGTVIRFDDNGFERIVAHAGEILPNETVKIVKGIAKIPDYEKSVLCELKAGVHFVKAPLELKGEYQNIQHIRIQFGPFENEVISEWALLNWLENNPRIYKRIQNRWIIMDTLKSTTIDYQFINASGVTVKVSLNRLTEILGSVGAEGQWTVKDEFTLRYTGSLYLGYKLVRVNELTAGTGEGWNRFEVEIIDPMKYKIPR